MQTGDTPGDWQSFENTDGQKIPGCCICTKCVRKAFHMFQAYSGLLRLVVSLR